MFFISSTIAMNKGNEEVLWRRRIDDLHLCLSFYLSCSKCLSAATMKLSSLSPLNR
ncbi:MAG: hypothetical protein RSB15_08865 [Clostridium sp.]